MGQGNSKGTKPQEAGNDKSLPQETKCSSASPAVEATPSSFRDGASPSLSHKLINYFSPKSDETASKAVPGQSKNSLPSPFPPSSSLLAKGYREELGGISPAQHNRISSSFFLGKVLISPRRPLREGSHSSQDLSSPRKNVLYELGTPKSLKRKASPETSIQSKKMRHDNTASPSLKHDWKRITMQAQVEEQDEDEEEIVEPPTIEEVSENLQLPTAENEALVLDADDQPIVSELESVEETGGEALPFNEKEVNAEESCLSAPYSPSQPPRSHMSVMNFSSFSSATCESPGPAFVPHNATIEELDEDVSDETHTEQNEEENVTLSQTIGKGLWLLKETILGTDPKPSASEEPANQQERNEEELVFDAFQAIDGDKSESESVTDIPSTTPSSETLENGNTEMHEGERSSSEARSHCSSDEYDVNINNLPRAGTTHSSTVSKKMLKSEYRVTESKVPSKQKSEEKDSPKKVDGKVEVTLRSPSSEDSFYHHPLSRSTFSSSISKGKWPSFSLISTSSVSSIPVASFQFFKSIITSESYPTDPKNSNDALQSATASDVPDTLVKTNETDSLCSTNNSSSSNIHDSPVELAATIDSDTTLTPTQNGIECKSSDQDESCVLELQPDDLSNGSIENDSTEKVSKGEQTPENQGKNQVSPVLAATPLMTKSVSPKLVTPKRSSRIASIQTSQKTIGSNSPVESKTGTPSNSARRRRRRSSSSESNASLHTSKENRDVSESAALPRSVTKRQRLDNLSSDHSSNGSAATTGNEHHKKSSTPSPKSLSTQGKFKDLSLLRDDVSAQHARDNQLLIVVVRSGNNSSSALIRELRLQFPLGSFISAAAKHSKKSRRAASQAGGLKQLERSVMQQMSPIIVEGTAVTAMGPYLLIAHSANYNSVVLHEAAFSSMLPYQPARGSLPFCYSWFLSLTDSVELGSVAQRLLRQLLALPVVRRDLLQRTQHRSSSEFMQSYIRNNTVGGPEILHCTAKGGTSASDIGYTARRGVLRALGHVSTLQVVGFVITPRTFGARVKLNADQLTLWDNSDSPTVPQAIASLIDEQKALVPEVDGHDLVDDLEDDSADDQGDILGYDAGKKSIKFIPSDVSEGERFIPTSGLGSRAHITLGCHTQKVHPRTTGFDLLLALEMEKAFNKKTCSNGTVEGPNNDDISDKAGDHENREHSSLSRGNTPQEDEDNSKSTENGVGDCEVPAADTENSAMSGIAEEVNVPFESGNSGVKSTSEVTDCVTVTVDGATVRGYGEGVWVVYPEQYITVSAVFAGFHNAE